MTVYLTASQVTELHDEAIAVHGGTPGLRDPGALASAAAQAAMEAFGMELYSTVVDKAAAYLYFLSRNHAFMDGNKRAAYASAHVFLLMNGFDLSGSDDELFELILQTAQGHLADPRAVAERLEHLVTPLQEA